MELVDIFNKAEADKSLVSLKAVHRALKVKSHFRDWVKRRLRQYKEHVDFEIIASESLTANDGRPSVDYFIADKLAKELVIPERGGEATKFRDYLIQAEEQVKSWQQLTPLERFCRSAEAMVKEEKRISSALLYE